MLDPRAAGRQRPAGPRGRAPGRFQICGCWHFAGIVGRSDPTRGGAGSSRAFPTVRKNYLARCRSHTLHIVCLTVLSNVVFWICRNSNCEDRHHAPSNRRRAANRECRSAQPRLGQTDFCRNAGRVARTRPEPAGGRPPRRAGLSPRHPAPTVARVGGRYRRRRRRAGRLRGACRAGSGRGPLRGGREGLCDTVVVGAAGPVAGAGRRGRRPARRRPWTRSAARSPSSRSCCSGTPPPGPALCKPWPARCRAEGSSCAMPISPR